MSDLVGNPEDRFSRDAAHMLMFLQQMRGAYCFWCRFCSGFCVHVASLWVDFDQSFTDTWLGGGKS